MLPGKGPGHVKRLFLLRRLLHGKSAELGCLSRDQGHHSRNGPFYLFAHSSSLIAQPPKAAALDAPPLIP